LNKSKSESKSSISKKSDVKNSSHKKGAKDTKNSGNTKKGNNRKKSKSYQSKRKVHASRSNSNEITQSMIDQIKNKLVGQTISYVATILLLDLSEVADTIGLKVEASIKDEIFTEGMWTFNQEYFIENYFHILNTRKQSNNIGKKKIRRRKKSRHRPEGMSIQEWEQTEKLKNELNPAPAKKFKKPIKLTKPPECRVYGPFSYKYVRRARIVRGGQPRS